MKSKQSINVLYYEVKKLESRTCPICKTNANATAVGKQTIYSNPPTDLINSVGKRQLTSTLTFNKVITH